jgi:hypothetical protein
MRLIEDILEFFRNLNTISLSEVPARIQYILDIVRHPEAHSGLPIALVVGVIITVLLIVMSAIALGYLLVTKDKRASLDYAIYDEQGELVAQIPVEEVSAEDLALLSGGALEDEDVPGTGAHTVLQSPTQTPLVKGMRTFLAVSVATVVGLFAVGTGTSFDSSCVSCHSQDDHRAAIAQDTHESVRCVRCHETGGMVASYSINGISRTAHIARGLFVERNVESFQSERAYVASSSCLQCHTGIPDRGVTRAKSPSGRDMKISHAQILDAGMKCATCHGIDPLTRDAVSAGVVMETCLRCHNTETASAKCTTCHVGDWELREVPRSAQGERGAFADRRLVSEDPRYSCYRCHNPSSCDPCHAGVRMPHPKAVLNPAGNPRAHIDLVTESGGGVSRCFHCHSRDLSEVSPMGAHSCLGCHPGF